MAIADSARARVGAKIDWIAAAGLAAAGVCAAPALCVIGFALFGAGRVAQLDNGLIGDAVLTSGGLALVGGGGALVLGGLSAWLATLCKFPGRGAFEWALALPLAAPSYVLAYAYSSLTWAGGPIDFPVRGFWGAAFIYAIGLYPYVYLAARAAFASQSMCALDAGRTLGARPWRAFIQIAAPLARPGLAAGAALAVMEIIADYGAAKHFGLTTLSTAVFRAWGAHGSVQSAVELSALLLLAALAFLALERWGRGRRSFAGTSARWRPLERIALAPLGAGAASVFCGALLFFGAGLPLMWLARLALLQSEANSEAFVRALMNSLILASVGAVLTLTLATLIANAGRRGGRAGNVALLGAAASYATPGAVAALGALALFGLARDAGLIGGLGGGLGLAALFWVYAARFAAAGAQPIDAGLARLSGGLEQAARTLGASPMKRLMRVDLPIAAPSVAAAALIVFVEVLKELPATLILRPFNFDTLAVLAFAYADDGRLVQAAAPSLLIFLAGLAPMLVLTRAIVRARAGVR